MRLRSSSFIIGLFAIIISVFLIGQLLNLPSEGQLSSKKEEMKQLEKRMRKLENDIEGNQEVIVEIKKIVEKLGAHYPDDVFGDVKSDLGELERKNEIGGSPDQPSGKVFMPPTFNMSSFTIPQDECLFTLTAPSSVDIQMKDVYDILPFDNIDGGPWKQGWQIQYDENQWSPTKKLKIFVVPHSHNDPGWIKTFGAYYKDQTRHILDNMVVKLSEDHRRKFIWAEISYFAEWWQEQSEETRKIVKGLLQRGQLEIVTGGWVMPDEATTHFESILDQMTTGHEWMKINLGLKPSNGWAIDPFGLSPTVAYLLKRSGFQNMLIQRGHYSLKKHLAREKSLEFRWRQIWDAGTSTDILCHLMPFYSYDVPHTCGPDPKICCQFDFRRLPRMGISCPWRIAPQPITYANVKAKSQLLLDQYRKKAQLFRTNVLLVPLGDDFRYNRQDEWDLQFGNYQQLFDYMNSRSDLNVHAQFGTLADYFSELREESNRIRPDDASNFPSLSGDFFTYADRDDHYWSGYYTTRPFYKRMNRILQSYLRTTEILYSLMLEKVAHTIDRDSPVTAISFLRNYLVQARKDHGLFQHHDGITGTAKDHVVVDYSTRMLDALRNCQHVIQWAAHVLLSESLPSTDLREGSTSFFQLQEYFQKPNSLALENVLTLSGANTKRLFIINSEAHRRQQLVTVKVDSPYVQVFERNGDPVLCQVDPVFISSDSAMPNEFYVTFQVNADPISISEILLKDAEANSLDRRWTTFSKIRYSQEVPSIPKIFSSNKLEPSNKIILKSSWLTATFGTEGLLEHLKSSSFKADIGITFVTYGSRGSGAYLFLPNGNSREIVIKDLPIITIEGVFISSLMLFSKNFQHQVTLKNSPGIESLALEIDNYVDIRRERDYELAMKVKTSVQSADTFYTDLNGFQIIKRTTYSKIPIQGNVYPMTTQVFIEDQESRVSVLSSQPLGVASLKEGEMEIFMDRQLTLDDNRGLGQGIHDNVLTLNRLNLLVEARHQPNPENRESFQHESTPAGYPSLNSHSLLNQILKPVVLIWPKMDIPFLSHWTLGGELPNDVDLVSLKVMLQPSDEKPTSVALVLHRKAFSCSFVPTGITGITNNGKLRLAELFPASFSENVKQQSLSQLYEGIDMVKSYTLSLKPMELYAFEMEIAVKSN